MNLLLKFLMKVAVVLLLNRSVIRVTCGVCVAQVSIV